MPEDPLLSFKYQIEIDQIIEGLFTECTGISVEREVESYKEGGVNQFEHKLPGRIKYGNVTLKRGMTTSNKLWEWFNENANSETDFFKVKRLSVSIKQMDLAGNPVRHWSLEKAYPVKWKGPDLKSDNSQAAVETIEIAHHGIKLIET